MNVTFGQMAAAAQAAGRLGTFDTALPQDFADDVHALTGHWPQQVGVVWNYPATGPGRLFGEPYPLTPEAADLLNAYALALLLATAPPNAIIVIEVETTA